MNEDELRKAFELRRPHLKALGEWVAETIVADLTERLGPGTSPEKFLKIWPKPRVKETDSFLEKALIRKSKDDPLRSVTDQVGVRFVVLLLEEIDVVGELVRNERWTWSKDRDHEQERLKNPNFFAYQSDHYVITTTSPVEYAGLTVPVGMTCEIQIRTLLQHAYAEMAHGCDYKPSIKLPDERQQAVRRSLAKGSALIETTGDVFSEIVGRINEYSQSLYALLDTASEIYQTTTGEVVSARTPLALIITDTYRETLKDLTSEDLADWVKEHEAWCNGLAARRSESVLFRDPAVLIIGWLATNREIQTPTMWPFDAEYLEMIYLSLGKSIHGLF